VKIFSRSRSAESGYFSVDDRIPCLDKENGKGAAKARKEGKTHKKDWGEGRLSLES